MLNVEQKVSVLSLRKVGYLELRMMFSIPVNNFNVEMLLLRRVIR